MPAAKKEKKSTVKKTTKTESKKAKKDEFDDIDLDINEIESLDSIKKRLLKKAKDNENQIEESEIFEETANLDLTDEETSELQNYFLENGISIVSDEAEDDIDNLEFDNNL